MCDVHPAAREGFSREAQTYTRGRPDYPDVLLPWLRDKLRLGPGKTVVDLGAGTGKSTQLLLRTGASVIAVEPVEAMRAQLARNLNVDALAGTAQSVPLADGSVDAVVCAQAFHWFATTTAVRELHRVLRPAGRLGLVWNARDESCEWVAAITRIITPYEADAPRFYKGTWRQAFTEKLFSELEETTFPYLHVGSAREVIIDRTLSVSLIAALPAADKVRVVARLDALIEKYPQLGAGGPIGFPYLTRAYYCIREPVLPESDFSKAAQLA